MNKPVYSRRWYWKHRVARLCIRCGRATVRDLASCDDCRARRKEALMSVGLKFPKPQRVAKARKPLKRTWMRPGKRKSKHARRERHFGYMFFIKHWVCAACEAFGRDDKCRCNEDGLVEAAHVGERKGHRASDLDVIPLGAYHHRIKGWDTYSGPFAGWDRLQRRAWAALQIKRCRDAWDAFDETTREWWNGLAEIARRRRAEGTR